MAVITVPKTSKPSGIVGVSALLMRYVTLTGDAQLADIDQTRFVNGTILGVSLPGDLFQKWKLRALQGGEVTLAGALRVCAADPTRCWVLVG